MSTPATRQVQRAPELARCHDIDTRLRALADRLGGAPEGLLVLGHGGYGRGDLTPHSDLDVLLLVRGDAHDAFLRTFVQGLWDEGLKPGHVLLHVDDIDGDLLTTPDRASALLEARYVLGDRSLATDVERRINEVMSQRRFRSHVELKFEEYRARRAKYGEVARVVEPHLKSQAGGLRDMQFVLWIDRARAAREGNWELPVRTGGAVKGLLGRLRRDGALNENETRELSSAYDTLLELRRRLRQRTKRDEDVLHVGHQVQLAREMGFSGNDDLVMRELMRQTFNALEKVARFADEFGPLLAGEESDADPVQLPKHPGLIVRGSRLELEDDAIRAASTDPDALLGLIGEEVDRGVTLTGRDRHRLRRELGGLRRRGPDPAIWHEPIRRLLSRKTGVGARLRRMDALDAISIWLPEWMGIVGLTTGSYYHTYTVDEHTLRAVERLDELPGDGPEGLPASLWEYYTDRPLVCFAILLHDIAKGKPGDHWEVGGEIALESLRQLGFGEWAESAKKLVEIHLRMEQVAFRRDAKDPNVLEEFARLVGDMNTLEALYLLTVCDLSAVSRGVWTQWKGHLLAELFLEMREWFAVGKTARPASVEDQAQRVAPHLGGDEILARNFLASMREEYRRAVPEEEIAQHVSAARDVASQGGYRWITQRREGYVVVTLIDRDRSGLLADVAGLLVTQGIGIREARIFTREDGIVVDRFRAEDIQTGGVPVEDRLAEVPRLWGELSEGGVTLDQLLSKFRRTRRLDRHPAAYVESEIRISPHPSGALIDVSGPDSVGLLYRLCSVIAGEGFDVHAARVSRRIDGIVDAFLLHDPKGRLSEQHVRLNLIQKLREAADAPV